MFDLVICIRCHRWPLLIEDTAEAVARFTDPRTTKIMFAVDGNPGLGRKLAVHHDAVYVSPRVNGWGAGLQTLLFESILWAEKNLKFAHFLTIDYDTLFAGPGADSDILEQVVDPCIGIVGNRLPSSCRWRPVFLQDKARLEAVLGPTPSWYLPGEGVSGGCFLITRSFLSMLALRGWLGGPAANPKQFTSMADDHLICLYCRHCGLNIVEIAKPQFNVHWSLVGDPYKQVDLGHKVFHPVKVRPMQQGISIELHVRNHYRKLRGLEPLPQEIPS